jgi:hypothetical protein
MIFHVVPLSQEQARQSPPISKLLLDRTELAVIVVPHPPINLFCDGGLAGSLPGFDINQTVYLLNDVAWNLCQGLSLNATKTMNDSELPPNYGTLIDRRSAGDGRRF